MIVRSRPRFWELIFMWRLSILPRIAPQVIMAAVVASAVVVLSQHDPELFRNFTAAPFTLLGIALSIFLGFRKQRLLRPLVGGATAAWRAHRRDTLVRTLDNELAWW